MCRPHRLAACLLTALAALGSPARGEVFVLKSGGRIEGEHLNPDRQPGQPYHVATIDGVKLSLPDGAVQRMIVKTDLDEQYESLLAKLPNTRDAQWNMAEWCREAGLAEERKRHLQAVINLDPDHAEARKALGYQRFGSRWLTHDEHMQGLGFVRYKGTWRLKQEVEIDSREVQEELATKKLRKDIRMWLEQVASGGRLADVADRNLNALNDPAAAPALADVLGDADQPRAIRQRCLTILSRLPPGLATSTLARLAMNDKDDHLADACLEELKRQGAHSVLPQFLTELKNKDNYRVNRAASCLAVLGDQNAALPLINALVTQHTFLVQQGSGPPGSMTTTFSPSGQSGGGGLSMGGKPKAVKKMLQNSAVLDALTSLYPGVNHQYDTDAWRAWYIQSQTTSNVDLRRDN